MELFFEIAITIGLIALIITIIRYPKDIFKGIFRSLMSPFLATWDALLFLFLPFELLILYLEKKFGVNYLTKFIDRDSFTTIRKTKQRKQINFQKFKKYVIVNSIADQIESELKEANESLQELNIAKHRITRNDAYSVIELPETGFYGYNYIIQWFATHMPKNEAVGLATNERTSFLTLANLQGDNDMIGKTNTGKKFWVSLYDDLDKKQFLRMNEDIELERKFTTVLLKKLVDEIIQ